MSSVNPYDLLSNDELHSKKPQVKAGPGKPDKSDQRRSVPRGGASSAGASSSEPRQQHQRNRVDDRDRRGGRGGARGGRGGGRGRGGYHGTESDGVHRNFDRKQGEQSRHAPGEARKHGAVGEANPTAFHGSAEEYVEQEKAEIAEANGDVVMDEILDITPMPQDPEDSKMTLDQYLAQRNRPEDDINRQTRVVSEDQEGDFRVAKPLKKVEEGIFGEVIESSSSAEEKQSGSRGGKKKTKISLDEFVGDRPSTSSSSGRGGRGGFQGESRGGRGGHGAQRGGSGAPQRGGRGGHAAHGGQQRGGRGANVNIADQAEFPGLSLK